MNGLPTDASGTSRLPPITLFLLAALAALGSLATNIILPAFPQIGTDIGVSPRDLALTLSTFFVAFASGQLLVGPLSDRYGRRRLVLGGLMAFVAGSFICAAADGFGLLMAGRVVQALGACAASVLSRAIARDLFEGDVLARALAIIMIAMAASPGFSPLLGSALNSLFGWKVIFLTLAAFAGLLAFLYLRVIGETHASEHRVALGFAAVAWGYVRLAGDRRFIRPGLAVSLIIGSLYTFFAAAPGVLISVLGLTGLQLALYFAATVVIVFSAGLAATRLAAKWGSGPAATLGLAFALGGSGIMLAFAETPDLATLTIGLGFFLFGMGLVNPLATAIALQPFGREAGLASALLGFMQMGCAAAGSALASLLPLTPTFSMAAIMLSASVVATAMFAPVGLSGLRGKAST